MPTPAPSHLISYAVMLVALVLVIRRNMRGRRLRVEALWIMPAVMIALTAFVIAAEPEPAAATVAGLVLSALVGAAVGWQRGRFTRIELDPATHSFTSRASVAGMIFIAVLFLARLGLRAYVAATARNPAVTMAVSDALLLFAVGLVSVQRLEMWLRCRRMLAERLAARQSSSIAAP
ncbi:MAG TPA: hypothetical protein VMU59_02190 [Caulobacteraceae bacterium]|nr:hypothetical protein [Caulobacteraceae bacterium]